MFVKFLFLNQRSSLGVVVITFGFSAEALVWIWVKAIFCLHFNSAAKKVQNQICPGWISHVHQKWVLTLTLCVYQKCVQFFRRRCRARYGRPLASLRARRSSAAWQVQRVGNDKKFTILVKSSSNLFKIISHWVFKVTKISVKCN